MFQPVRDIAIGISGLEADPLPAPKRTRPKKCPLPRVSPGDPSRGWTWPDRSRRDDARLACRLVESGYGIRRTDRAFELASVSRELIEKFPKRTRTIEQLAREKYAIIEARARALVKRTGMEFADAFAQIRSELGALPRERICPADGRSAFTAVCGKLRRRERNRRRIHEGLKVKLGTGLAEVDLPVFLPLARRVG